MVFHHTLLFRDQTGMRDYMHHSSAPHAPQFYGFKLLSILTSHTSLLMPQFSCLSSHPSDLVFYVFKVFKLHYYFKHILNWSFCTTHIYLYSENEAEEIGYGGRAWLYDAMILILTFFCLQHLRAAHALHSAPNHNK